MKQKRGSTHAYGIIGLGRFGSALAEELAASGAEVLVIDRDESKVRDMREHTDYAFVTSDLSRESLTQLGIQNCAVVVICIGERLDTSVFTALNVVSLGVPRVIAKAVSAEHGMVLEKLGVEVVYPERDMALRLAKRLTTRNVLEYISLTSDVEISELCVGGELVGRSIGDCALRRNYGVNIIAIQHEEETRTCIDPAYIFRESDVMVVIGRREDIKALEHHL